MQAQNTPWLSTVIMMFLNDSLEHRILIYISDNAGAVQFVGPELMANRAQTHGYHVH